jgi:hypothetical protein
MWQVLQNGEWVTADDDTILRWISTGSILPTTPIRHASWPGPQPVGSVAGFQHALRTKPKQASMSVGILVTVILLALSMIGGAVYAVFMTRSARSSAEADREELASAVASNCAHVGVWTVCMTGVTHPATVGGEAPKNDGAFTVVAITIAHDSKTTEDTLLLDYDLEASNGNRYSVDDDSSIAASIDHSLTTCGMLGDQVQPGETERCSLVYRLPKDASDLRLVVREKDFGEEDQEARIPLSAAP